MLEIDWSVINSAIREILVTLVIPAAIGAVGVLIKIVKKQYNTYAAKAEVEKLAKMSELKNTLLKEIESVCVRAVGANMQVAKQMKAMNPDGKLTDEQSATIKANVKSLVYASLPVGVTDESSAIMTVVIGGKDRLDTLIDNMIENAVYNQKK